MRDTLIGLTTMVILFGMVWLAQSNVSPTKNITESDVESHSIPGGNENVNEMKIDVKNVYAKTEEIKAIAPCELCNDQTDVSDNFTFGEAFSFCRQCIGDEGVFLWQSKLYTTNIKTVVERVELVETKELIDDLVENEITESNTPPKNNDSSVISK